MKVKLKKQLGMYTEIIKEDKNNYDALYTLAQCQLAQSKFDEGGKILNLDGYPTDLIP